MASRASLRSWTESVASLSDAAFASWPADVASELVRDMVGGAGGGGKELMGIKLGGGRCGVVIVCLRVCIEMRDQRKASLKPSCGRTEQNTHEG